MKPARWLLVLPVLALLAAGCQTLTELGHEFDPGQRPADRAFTEVVDRYIDSGALYHGPETEMLLKVLPGNWAVRKAWTERRAVAFAWNKAQKEKDLKDQKAEYDRNIVLLASVFVPQRKWNNWEAQASNWRVYLINAKGQRLEPSDTRRIKRRSAINEAIYPFWGSWDRLYVVKFPWKLKDDKPFLAKNEKSATLLVTGPPGKIKLNLVVR